MSDDETISMSDADMEPYFKTLQRARVMMAHPHGHHSATQPDVHLAGLIPIYSEQGKLHTYVMRPKAEKPKLGTPQLQIGKGTRRIKDGKQWRDANRADYPISDSKDKAEPLVITALREGQEELGLVLDNILLIYDCGVHSFFSSTTEEEKRMAVFMVAMDDPAMFVEPDPKRSKTAERRWVVPGQEKDIKPDHAEILKHCVAML